MGLKTFSLCALDAMREKGHPTSLGKSSEENNQKHQRMAETTTNNETMTPEEQRIAIAEVCGWKWHHCPTSNIEIDQFGQLLKLGSRKWSGWVKGKHPDAAGYWHQTYAPDYLHDLNSMHEAEKALFGQDKPVLSSPQPSAIYENELIRVVVGELGFINGECCLCHGQLVLVAHATAAQRAEAFLKCLGKWKD